MTALNKQAQQIKQAALRAKAATEDYVAGCMSIAVCLSECEEFNRLTDGPDQILPLIEALETKEEQRANWFQMAQKLGEDLDAAEKRIAELESKNSNLQTIAHEQNELAIRANLDSINDAVEMDSLHKRIAELEAKLETADKLQDSAFRHGLQHGFSYGQTNDQAGYEECLKSYSSRGKDDGEYRTADIKVKE